MRWTGLIAMTRKSIPPSTCAGICRLGLNDLTLDEESFEQPWAYTIRQVLHVVPFGRTTLYKAIGDGDLIAVRIGARTYVRRVDLAHFLETRPTVPTRNQVPTK